jgi:hypothetical protein
MTYTPLTGACVALELSRQGTRPKSALALNLTSLKRILERFPRTNCDVATSSSARANSEATMSFWTKTLRPIVKVAARAVAAVYTGGASEALLAAAGQSGLGISDLMPQAAQDVVDDARAQGNVLLEQATARYPNVALLAANYRDFRPRPEQQPSYDEEPQDEFVDEEIE